MISKKIAFDGQLNNKERELIRESISSINKTKIIAIEIGTWYGGGSTLHILKEIISKGGGHLYGIEADQSIYHKMVENISNAIPDYQKYFTPVFGFSQNILPKLLENLSEVDFAFLDGGNQPQEQIDEYKLLANKMPIGGILMAHDVKLRKGKWLVPYVHCLDNWECELYNVSEEGLFVVKKIAEHPSRKCQKKANMLLMKLKLNPTELAAVILPKKIKIFLLKLLPTQLQRKLTDGR